MQVATLTLPEIQLAAAAVTVALPRYPNDCAAFKSLKALQCRLLTLEANLSGDHPNYVAAMNSITADELAPPVPR